jgi:C4-dicarboxylate-specific signal transduction histidine kinase
LCREKFAYAGIDVGVPEDDLEIEVKCVPEQIGQVLLNLLSNSYDAVKSLETKWVKIEIERSGEFVVLRVTDSGSGISEAIQKKLMQPFFTTKTVGQGTGIGLSISRGIAEKHGGSLEYDPASQQTSFRLKLPVSTSAAA